MRAGRERGRRVEAADREVHARRIEVLEAQRRAAAPAETAPGEGRRGEVARRAARPRDLVLAQVDERRARVAERELAHPAVAVVALAVRRRRAIAHGAAQA